MLWGVRISHKGSVKEIKNGWVGYYKGFGYITKGRVKEIQNGAGRPTWVAGKNRGKNTTAKIGISESTESISTSFDHQKDESMKR